MDFERFYTTHYHDALRYVMKRIGNQQDAEDVLSDTFLYCYDHFSDYNPNLASERTWLYVVLKSRIRNYFRDRRITEELDALETSDVGKSGLLEEAAELQELRNLLAEALLTLPEKQKKLVILRYFYDCNTAEMAERTGMSPGNARTTLSRALATIEKYLNTKGYGKE